MATTSKKGRATATPKKATVTTKKAVAPAKKPAPKKATTNRGKSTSSHVLSELKGLARELKQAANGLNKKAAQNPRQVSSILGNVERMTADAANKSLAEAEAAKTLVTTTLDSLSKNWNRQEIETNLKLVSSHLTNIIVAQEFQDLAGQSLRKAMKALVGAIIVVEGGGPTEDKRLSQSEVDGLLKDLMP
jgi:chemotaxis regulatin CheY-phosphate phosphatase CheZ